MPLTDPAIKKAKFEDKQYKISDEKGMYLLVNKSGKYFRLDYRFAGKRKTLALGVYPDISLKEAREKRDEARKLIANDIDPSEAKKNKKHSLYEDTKNSFFNVATEWFAKNKSKWSLLYAEKKWAFLDKEVFPYLGNKPIKSISPRDLLTVLERIQDRGAVEVAHRVKNTCGEVFRYGITASVCERDPSKDLQGALIPKRNQNMACITEPDKLGGLLRAIDGYEGEHVTKCALRLTPLLFVRPGELRHMEWSEVDLKNAMWKIPAEKMKMRRPHMVPLSKQAVKILKDIQPLTGNWKYVFPSVRSKDRAMSNNTITAALRRMGYTGDEMTTHGFRAVASTMLHEKGYDSAIIEAQLAHADRNKIRATYNHAEYLDKRTEMMQWWADYLGELKK